MPKCKQYNNDNQYYKSQWQFTLIMFGVIRRLYERSNYIGNEKEESP